MTVSKVREGLKGPSLGQLWGAAEPDAARRAPAGRDRSEALAWVRRQLAWEHRLAGIREQATASDDTPVGEGPDPIPLAE